jgi:hypothetical protein
MSLGQGRFLEKRLKQKILQERSDATQNLQVSNSSLLEDELSYENMEEQYKKILMLETGSLQKPKGFTLTKNKESQLLTKRDNKKATTDRIEKIVNHHCKENQENDNFSTQLLGIMESNKKTGLSETGSRFAELDK